MANRWGNNGNSERLDFLGLQNHCSPEIKRLLLIGRKAMINLGSVLKSRDVTSLTKVHTVKGMVFPVVAYGGESWTIKKAEHWRTDAFALWCWRRFLRIPWTARSNQSILKEINPEFSLEWLLLKQAPTLWPPDAKSQLIGKDRCWERLKAKREGGKRWWDS